MNIPRWRKVNRKRDIYIRYTDPNFVKYYDIDMEDFQNMVMKLKNDEILEYTDNERYGTYIITMCIIVQEGPRFKNKPIIEREEILEQQYMELLQGLMTFNPEKGRLYSYAYRIAYTAAIHYYTMKKEEKEHMDAIIEHCMEELDEYRSTMSTHKVNNINKEMR